jgi:pentatricopeptide repeat protein
VRKAPAALQTGATEAPGSPIMKLQPAVFIGGVFYLAMTQALMSEFKPTLSLMLVVLLFHVFVAGLYYAIDQYQLKTEVSDQVYNHMIARQAHNQQWDKILDTLTAMQKKGLKPTVRMYNSMLKGN